MPAEKKHASLTEALAAVQAHLPMVGKSETATVRSDKGTYSYSYADLAQITKAIMPLLSANGLAWLCRPTVVDGRFVLAYELRHVSGEKESGEYPLSGNTPQQHGSAITYARRYCLCSVTGVAPESDDDDAKAASHRQYEPEPPAESSPTDRQTERFGQYRTEIKAASLLGLEAMVPEIKQAAEDGGITDGQSRRLAELWQERKAELEAKAKPAAGSAPEGEQSDA